MGSYLQPYASTPSASSYITKPNVSISSSNAGLKLLDRENDIFIETSTLTYSGTVNSVETNSLTSLVAHSTSANSTSSFAYGAAQLLLANNIISHIPLILTGSDSAVATVFRGAAPSTFPDIVSDYLLNLGNVGVVSLKKDRFGELITPMSFNFYTSNGTYFTDSISTNKDYGILTCNGSSAGYIFYDTGIAVILGATTSNILSLSSISSVSYASNIDIHTFTMLCSASSNELNTSTNETIYYNTSVTSNPDDSPDDTLSVTTIVDSFSGSIAFPYTLQNGGNTILAQSFTGTNTTLSSATFYIKKIGSPTGPINYYLYNAAYNIVYGLFTPVGDPISYSISSFDASTLTTNYLPYTLTFNNNYLMSSGVAYAIAAGFNGGGVSDSIEFPVNISPASANGYSSLFDANSRWSPFAGVDLLFSIVGLTLQNGLGQYTASGYQWGLTSSTGAHSNYILKNMKNRTPYITTIGFYNDKNEMLMVGKLTQPIIKPANMPITIRVSYDL